MPIHNNFFERISIKSLVVSEKVCTFAPAKKKDAPVAQLVEHLTLNQGVQSSSLCGCTSTRRLPIWLSW